MYDKLLELGMYEVTSNIQKKNGTRAFAIDTNEGTLVYALYKSGYVRSVNRAGRAYQLNKTKEVKTKSLIVDAETNEVLYTRDWPSWNMTKRIPIETEEDRVDFLYDYIKNNFEVRFVSKRSINQHRGKEYKELKTT